MKPSLVVLAAVVALTATEASAQGVDLTGPYRCVQMCRTELPGQQAFITQNGWNMNLLNEAGQPSRGWFDRPGRIWAQNWQEGASVSPDGSTIWFDRGTVWQRDLGLVEPEPVPVDRLRRGQRRAAAPPVAGPPAAAPPVARSTATRSSNLYDGSWSVAISTHSGPCDPQYRVGVQIINGNVVSDGGQANLQGRVAPNGSVWVSVAAGGGQADGQGRMSQNVGTGTWRGQGSGSACAGTWQAVRRG